MDMAKALLLNKYVETFKMQPVPPPVSSFDGTFKHPPVQNTASNEVELSKREALDVILDARVKLEERMQKINESDDTCTFKVDVAKLNAI